MNAYARSLPALGFDPAPGDVDLTRNLAWQHALVAPEARQVLALVGRLNLGPLQGQAADALRTLQGTFPPALRSTASAAESLQAAASSWADQQSGSQAEADALERQAAAAAAQQQALQARQATLPPGTVVLTDDLQTASAAVIGIHGQTRELHQRYLAAASKTAASVVDQVLNATTDWVPGWGEAVIAVTSAYLAGDFLFHRRALLGHVASDVGHAVVTSVEQTVDGDVSTAKAAGHLATSAWHSVTSSIGSWI